MRKLLFTFVLLLLAAFMSSPVIAIAAASSDTTADTAYNHDNTDHSADYHPILVLPPFRNDRGWVSSERYEFSHIDGYQEIYNADEQFVFYVDGKSDKMHVEKANGFDLVALLFDPSTSIGKRADVGYDPDRHVWEVKLIAPKDNTKEYKVVLTLFCKKNDSPCSTTYGFGTQVDKILPLKVR